ncbi:hypothetical protein Btru_060458 [Bulinus truncatus]|nr:hypothetical protein Btru_060458 [Bulinus truncatus]
MSGKYNLESRRQKYLSKSSGTFRKLDQPLALDYQTVTSQSGHSNGKTNTRNQQTNIISQQTKYNERAVDVQFLETTDQDKQTLGIKRSTDNGQTTLAENVASRSKDKNDFKSSETVSTKTSDANVAESKEIKAALTGGENISPLPHSSKRLDEKLKSDEKKHGGLFERLKRSWKKREDEESLEFWDKKKNKTRQSSSSSSSSEDGDGQRSNGHEMYEIKLPHNDSQNSLELKISDNTETVTEIHSVCYENMTQTVPQPTINVCTDVIPEETEEVAERDSDYINVIDAVSDYYENVDELFPGYDNSFFTDLMPGEFGTSEDDVNFTEIVPDHCENVPTLDAANSVTEHDESTDNQFAESIYDVVEVFDNYQNFVQKDFQIAVPFELPEVSRQTRNVSEINVTLGESLSRDEPMKYCTTLTIDLTQKTVEGHPGDNEVDHVTSDESSLADGEEYVNTMCDSDGSDIIIDDILSNGPHEISTEKNSYPKPYHQTNHYSEKRFFLPDSHVLHQTEEKMLIFDNQAVQHSDDKFLVTDEHLVGLNDQKLFVSENQNLHNIDNQITEPDNQEEKWMNQPNTSSKSSSKLSSASNSPDSLRKFLTTFVPASNNSEKLPEQQEWKLFDQVDDERPGIYENVFNQEKKEDQWSECLFQAYSSDEPFVNTSQAYPVDLD